MHTYLYETFIPCVNYVLSIIVFIDGVALSFSSSLPADVAACLLNLVESLFNFSILCFLSLWSHNTQWKFPLSFNIHFSVCVSCSSQYALKMLFCFIWKNNLASYLSGLFFHIPTFFVKRSPCLALVSIM